MVQRICSALLAWQDRLVMETVTLLGLRILRQVAVTGSFAAAAVELGYTQSAVSRQMAALESAVGEQLFERGRRGVTLTPAAQIVLSGAGRALAELETTGQQLAGLRDRVGGRLVIGAFPTACSVLVPRAVAALRDGHPALTVIIDEAPTPVLLRRMSAGRLDVALVALNDESTDRDLKDLARFPLPIVGMHVAVPAEHPLARRPTVRPEDLLDEPWIVGVGGSGDPQFGPWPGIANPRIAFSVRHWTTRLGLVAAGLGISVLPGTMAVAVPPGVRAIEVDDPSHAERSSVLLARNDAGPRTRLAVRALLAQATALRAELVH
ncbi:LysR family transcriptional regulator [Allobranchiibius huperziae]|uniref:DNA-binding transcriptional LysR family regulator n=1 Tax=Allobranchiibius huperziae TaxID=1874116 RepID=A0A853DEL9_9MICO|nr:LysR family transcriptional regulator [Allobranchiibius huperziae]NYJ76006.1 DNA-binding transcriptional LysR family regulator [Allobranchiibius huperziae]